MTETAKLYALPASHPCACVERAMRVKGMSWDRVDLIPVLHKPVQRLLFGQPTVPGLQLDGERIVGSRRILRRLDEIRPDPPLYPSEKRAEVEELERWGDEVLQGLARRLTWATARHAPGYIVSYSEGSNLPVPAPMTRASAPLIVRASAYFNEANDESAQRDLADLPGHLDKVDAAIADGVLGGDPPNAADLQIASAVRLLLTLGDVRPLVEGRPCAELARRLFPDYPGDVPAGTLPAARSMSE
jgi:glutathione S-transferase